MDHPDQRVRVVGDPSLMGSAVEEILRFTSVARHMIRTTTGPATLAGTDLPGGARVVLLYPSANRDEEVFDRPDDFLVDRSPNPHLAFGIGSHYCLGANLARMELDVILRTVLSRWADPAPSGDLGAVHRSNGLVDGVASMMVDLTGGA